MKTRLHIVLATSVLMVLAVGDTYGQIATASPGACYATAGGDVGQLTTIDLSTGIGTAVGTGTVTGGLPGLAIDSHGHIFATDRNNFLYRIHAATGVAAVVADLFDGTFSQDAGALVFDANDRLIGVNSFSEVGVIDTSSAVWTHLPAITSEVKGMAYSNDTLFVSTGRNFPGFLVVDDIGYINPDTGDEFLVGPTGLGGGTPDIAVSRDGKLYGTKGQGSGAGSVGGGFQVIRIDKATGAGTPLANPIGFSASGFACDTRPPPPTDGKVFVCHKQGPKGKQETLHIDASSLQDHLDHGDTAGVCEGDDVADEGKGKSEGKGKGNKSGKFEASTAVPVSYLLSQNYPNPFNPTTTISFALPEAASVRLAVFNAVGQEVKVLVSSTKEAGTHTATWDATDWSGRRVATGMYIYRLTTGTYVETRKMLLLE